MNGAANVSLELDDIQRGVLQQWASNNVGTYLLFRIDERTAGRELVRRLLPAIASASSLAKPHRERLGFRCVHLSGPRGLRRTTGVA